MVCFQEDLIACCTAHLFMFIICTCFEYMNAPRWLNLIRNAALQTSLCNMCFIYKRKCAAPVFPMNKSVKYIICKKQTQLVQVFINNITMIIKKTDIKDSLVQEIMNRRSSNFTREKTVLRECSEVGRHLPIKSTLTRYNGCHFNSVLTFVFDKHPQHHINLAQYPPLKNYSSVGFSWSE